jgi:hypothetical protein
MIKKMTAKKKTAKTARKPSKVTRSKKKSSPAVVVRRPSRTKPTVPSSGRSKQFQALHGAYYAVGAVALAFSFLLLFYGLMDRSHSLRKDVRGIAQVPLISSESSPFKQTWLESEFQRLHSKSIPERVDFWSAALENGPLIRTEIQDLLGKKMVSDSAPLFPEKLDCTTFVETVIALSRSDSSADFFQRLIEVRYRDAQPSFPNRNHFVEADWIPNNEKSQVLKDITADLATSSRIHVQAEDRTLHRSQWISDQVHRQGLDREIASVPAEIKEVRIAYLPLESIETVLSQIPSGAIINFVREKSPKHSVLVSHQGIAVRNSQGQLMLRHASIGGHIRTESLVSYLEGMNHHNRKRVRWGWVGLNVNQIKSSSPSKILRKDVM